MRSQSSSVVLVIYDY